MGAPPDRDSKQYKRVVSELRAMIVSGGLGGISIQQLQNDYRNVNEKNIPFSDLGYPSLLALLKDNPDTIMVKEDRVGGVQLSCRYEESTAHIQKLINQTKSKKSKVSSLGGNNNQRPSVAPAVYRGRGAVRMDFRQRRPGPRGFFRPDAPSFLNRRPFQPIQRPPPPTRSAFEVPPRFRDRVVISPPPEVKKQIERPNDRGTMSIHEIRERAIEVLSHMPASWINLQQFQASYQETYGASFVAQRLCGLNAKELFGNHLRDTVALKESMDGKNGTLHLRLHEQFRIRQPRAFPQTSTVPGVQYSQVVEGTMAPPLPSSSSYPGFQFRMPAGPPPPAFRPPPRPLDFFPPNAAGFFERGGPTVPSSPLFPLPPPSQPRPLPFHNPIFSAPPPTRPFFQTEPVSSAVTQNSSLSMGSSTLDHGHSGISSSLATQKQTSSLSMGPSTLDHGHLTVSVKNDQRTVSTSAVPALQGEAQPMTWSHLRPTEPSPIPIPDGVVDFRRSTESPDKPMINTADAMRRFGLPVKDGGGNSAGSRRVSIIDSSPSPPRRDSPSPPPSRTPLLPKLRPKPKPIPKQEFRYDREFFLAVMQRRSFCEGTDTIQTRDIPVLTKFAMDDIGRYFEVELTCFYDPSHFYLRFVDKRFNRFQKDINGFYDTVTHGEMATGYLLTTHEPGSLCVVRSEHNGYLRAKILRVDDCDTDEMTVVVFLLDRGGVEVFNREDVLKMNQEIRGFAPAQAIKASLSALVPIEDDFNCDKWTSGTQELVDANNWIGWDCWAFLIDFDEWESNLIVELTMKSEDQEVHISEFFAQRRLVKSEIVPEPEPLAVGNGCDPFRFPTPSSDDQQKGKRLGAGMDKDQAPGKSAQQQNGAADEDSSSPAYYIGESPAAVFEDEVDEMVANLWQLYLESGDSSTIEMYHRINCLKRTNLYEKLDDADDLETTLNELEMYERRIKKVKPLLIQIHGNNDGSCAPPPESIGPQTQ